MSRPPPRASAWSRQAGQKGLGRNARSLSSPRRALAGARSRPSLCLYLGCFYGFNLNKGFLISCLRSCQSEKFLYYMRLEVLELSRLPNTQHHYPGCPLSLSAGAPVGCRAPLARPRRQPASLQRRQDLPAAAPASLIDQISPRHVMRAGKSPKVTFLIYLTIVFIKQIKNVSSCLNAHIGRCSPPPRGGRLRPLRGPGRFGRGPCCPGAGTAAGRVGRQGPSRLRVTVKPAPRVHDAGSLPARRGPLPR